MPNLPLSLSELEEIAKKNQSFKPNDLLTSVIKEFSNRLIWAKEAWLKEQIIRLLDNKDTFMFSCPENLVKWFELNKIYLKEIPSENKSVLMKGDTEISTFLYKLE